MAFKFENLIVWQRALDLSALVHEITLKFPKEELYILTSQMKRAAEIGETFRFVYQEVDKTEENWQPSKVAKIILDALTFGYFSQYDTVTRTRLLARVPMQGLI